MKYNTRHTTSHGLWFFFLIWALVSLFVFIGFNCCGVVKKEQPEEMPTVTKIYPRIFVDFDGTITTYKHGWQGYDSILDPPVIIDGVSSLDWLYDLIQDMDITILSGRAATDDGVIAITTWMKKNARLKWEDMGRNRGLNHITVTCKKTDEYVCQIGDRELNFDGTRFPSKEEIKSFIPWCKKGK